MPDYLGFIWAGDMQQEPIWVLLIDKRHKRTSFCASRRVQLDYVATLINALLEGWRVSHLFLTDADFVPSRRASSCLTSGNQGSTPTQGSVPFR
jgi:hypothetical protein